MENADSANSLQALQQVRESTYRAMAEEDAAGRQPSSPASVEAALRALDAVLGDEETAQGDPPLGGGGILLDSAVGSLLLPSFDTRGQFASYERREGAGLSIPSASPPASPSRSKAKKKEAMDHFITDPSGMNWEDLVELAKKKKEEKKRRKHKSRQGGQQRNWRSVADVLSTVDESETIDFYPKLSSFCEGDEYEENPPSSDKGEDTKPAIGARRPMRRYALACVALLFLVGVPLVFWGMAVSHEHRVAREDGSAVPEGGEEATGDVESTPPFAKVVLLDASPLEEYPARVTKDHGSGGDNSTDPEP